jgi:hypothetical protein
VIEFDIGSAPTKGFESKGAPRLYGAATVRQFTQGTLGAVCAIKSMVAQGREGFNSKEAYPMHEFAYLPGHRVRQSSMAERNPAKGNHLGAARRLCAFHSEGQDFKLPAHPIMSEETKPAEERRWKQLEHAVTLAAKQDQIVWAVFGVFCAAEAILLAGLFQNGVAPTGWGGPIMSTAGVAISVVWYLIQQRAQGWLDFYERVIIKLEDTLPVPVRLTVSKEDRQTEVKGESVRKLMVWCPRVCGLLWLATAIFWWVAKCPKP